MIELDSYGQVRLGTADGWSIPFSQPPFNSLDPADPVRLGASTAELADLVDAVERSRPPQVDGREGLATTMMLEAAEISARTRQACRCRWADGCADTRGPPTVAVRGSTSSESGHTGREIAMLILAGGS